MADLQPPEAPPASAPYEVRAEWAEEYVPEVLAAMDVDGDEPDDVRPTHLFEVEFNSCVLDPPEYERETESEILH